LVVRIGALDLSIALEAYHELELDGWQASLQAVRDEGQKWQSQVGRDSLTGLADHGHIIDFLQQALTRAQTEARGLCVVMADIDFFKRVNDTYGHLVGDQALSETATRIAGALRAGDIVGRYGGEEFLIVLDDTSIDTARRIAQRVCARVGEDPIQVDGLSVRVTLSEGVAAARAGDTAASLIARADAHLYRAKATGRNRVSAEPTRALACYARP
jgi:diguanylate cyclase (GGDEF)-like protein